ncbi:MAG: class I adenylate-forming enzyme family protein, partial [Acidimicrobiia bacterium]
MTAFRNAVAPDVAADYRARGWWGDVTLLDHVRRHARERPDDAAIIADSGTLSWAAYERAATRVAAALVDASIPEGARVAVILPDSGTVHAVFLGAELAGVTVVGIGARAGDREVRHLLGRTGAAALVSLERHRDRETASLLPDWRPEGGAPIRHVVVPRLDVDPDGPITVDGTPAATTVPAEALEARRVGPDDLFLVNSTSGTTGLPKCVMHTQNRWLYFHQQAVRCGHLDADDVVFSAVPAPFGFGLWTAHFTPAMLGAPLVVAEQFDADRTLALIEAHRVTMLAAVSTQFVMMLNAPSMRTRDLASLRVMFTGGEAVPYERADAFERETGCTVLQFFGSNETGLISGTTLEDPRDRRLRTAGKCIDDMQVRLYSNGRDVTASGRGQPAGRGPATCLGYLDDDAANRELFTHDGWMLMGDICTLDDEGWLTVVGRTSDFIIRGGKNISAAQVEDEVATHPAVALAAAVAQPDPVFGERVCVYAELQPGKTLELEELLAHLDARGT